MKRWAVLVAVLYGLMLAVLSLPFALLALAPQLNDKMTLKDAADFYGAWQWWLFLAVMGLAQAALLAVPVRFATRRPMSRSPLALTILAGALMMGGLVAGTIFSLCEFAFGDEAGDATHGSLTIWIALGMGLVSWGGWALIFHRLSRTTPPEDFVSRLCKTLLKGSILELLIAVPTHIVARCRDYCCAGFMTFIGLTMGVSVMLFSFGPGVFFLFVARWRRLHPAQDAAPSLPQIKGAVSRCAPYKQGQCLVRCNLLMA
jgi:hypothetical protein